MTHDELLARIDWIGTTKDAENNTLTPLSVAVMASLKALRAVVELHKPKGNFADTYVDGEPINPYCPECIDPDVYPCPTIQTIEKELG